MYTRIMEISPWTLRSAKLEKEHKRLQESLTSLPRPLALLMISTVVFR